MIVQNGNWLNKAAPILLPSTSLPYSPTDVAWDHLPSKLYLNPGGWEVVCRLCTQAWSPKLLSLVLTSCVALGKFLAVFKLQFLYVYIGMRISMLQHYSRNEITCNNAYISLAHGSKSDVLLCVLVVTVTDIVAIIACGNV